MPAKGALVVILTVYASILTTLAICFVYDHQMLAVASC